MTRALVLPESFLCGPQCLQLDFVGLVGGQSSPSDRVVPPALSPPSWTSSQQLQTPSSRTSRASSTLRSHLLTRLHSLCSCGRQGGSVDPTMTPKYMCLHTGTGYRTHHTIVMRLVDNTTPIQSLQNTDFTAFQSPISFTTHERSTPIDLFLSTLLFAYMTASPLPIEFTDEAVVCIQSSCGGKVRRTVIYDILKTNCQALCPGESVSWLPAGVSLPCGCAGPSLWRMSFQQRSTSCTLSMLQYLGQTYPCVNPTPAASCPRQYIGCYLASGASRRTFSLRNLMQMRLKARELRLLSPTEISRSLDHCILELHNSSKRSGCLEIHHAQTGLPLCSTKKGGFEWPSVKRSASQFNITYVQNLTVAKKLFLPQPACWNVPKA